MKIRLSKAAAKQHEANVYVALETARALQAVFTTNDILLQQLRRDLGPIEGVSQFEDACVKFVLYGDSDHTAELMWRVVKTVDAVMQSDDDFWRAEWLVDMIISVAARAATISVEDFEMWRYRVMHSAMVKPQNL